jgi:hypothetical protein
VAEWPHRPQQTVMPKTVANRTCDGRHVQSAIWGSMAVIHLRRNKTSSALVR